MNSSNNISIYIPRMSLFINENIIKDEFIKSIGEISRVDFTSIDKKPGFNENQNSLYKSAFIHFTNFYNSPYANVILSTINSEKGYKFYPKCKSEYWILLKAKNPISETWMNNAQIVENCRYLEKKLEIQEETIKYLKEKLEIVLEKMYKLEQKETILDLEIQDTLLSQQKQDIMIEKRNADNFSITTNSSMPSLINCYDYNYVSANSSIKDSDEYNSLDDLDMRVRNSFELCGNE